ncbi:MAG: LPS assembly lipoprotein LptE [Halofilum sp. (in: g-proteobacteria)]|nr:LPS assembly lipoprotein LptE [Halofilum sp. (in: g-proteobacteria)]
MTAFTGNRGAPAAEGDGRRRACCVRHVAGCGFQLRGAFELPAELVPVYIDAPRDSDVAGQLHQLLRRNNVEVATDRAAAASVIEIVGEQRERRVLTVSAATADVDEFELRYTTQWLLRDTGEERRALTNLETVEILRDYTYDRGAVLAKQSEEADLLERMQEDTALRILYRIQAWNQDFVPEPADVEAQLEKERRD